MEDTTQHDSFWKKGVRGLVLLDRRNTFVGKKKKNFFLGKSIHLKHTQYFVHGFKRKQKRKGRVG